MLKWLSHLRLTVFMMIQVKSSVIAKWRKSDLWIEQCWGKDCWALTGLLATGLPCDTREIICVAIRVSSLLIFVLRAFGLHAKLYMQLKVCKASQGDSSHLERHESAGVLMQALVFLASFCVLVLNLLFSLGLSSQQFFFFSPKYCWFNKIKK